MKKIYQLIFISIFLSASNTLISQITTTNDTCNSVTAIQDVLAQNANNLNVFPVQVI